ncbi:DUF4179 domain-containing protein [Bacillus sp. FJAT-50079]|uniref:DUF4179 domain-containing protein n=1 Tax=Bacillus sp. FJAT-50079 TaxID=2833577 RepID=UPI001BCA48B7|nr:DUF4179 domain-containing protein [Bacillus sp. FJAT-50079]MBS4210105.1 DUF4179 domain-containing protein [Bacillus sp. FJAT-50079]
MKNNFEKEFNEVMNEKKEIPTAIRESLDRTYEIIQVRSKRKRNFNIWRRVTAAACAMIATGIIVANEQALASIQDFFRFGDKGIERSISEGFVQENHQSITDQQIQITLSQHFSDANKLGLGFQLQFNNPTILNDQVTEVSLDYRVKNGDGEYIEEFIPDTKPKISNHSYISGADQQNPILDVKTGTIQYEVLLHSNEGIIPHLNNAVVEIESVNIFYGVDEVKKIDGTWNLPIANTEKNIPITEYTMANRSAIIQVSSAKANPTSLQLTFSIEGIFDNESPFVEKMKLMDEDGHVYEAEGFQLTEKDQQTIISTNLPFTSYQQAKKLTFIVEGIGKVELLKK